MDRPVDAYPQPRADRAHRVSRVMWKATLRSRGAHVILHERYGLRPELAPLDRAKSPPTLLLIGDKVVCDEPVGYPHQLDLGEAWKQLTGLPFVFAVWTARAGVELVNCRSDCRAKVEGWRTIGWPTYAVPTGWPADIAKRYLTEHLKFDVGPRHQPSSAFTRSRPNWG